MKLNVKIHLTLGRAPRRFALAAGFATEAQRVVLFGPSGAGKSLTLQAMAGLRRPDAGRIAIGDRVLFDSEAGIDLPARERRIGYLFQEHALFPHMSVARNVAFGLTPTMPWRLKADVASQVERMLERLDLHGLGQRLPHELSGGQRQRVALARALVRQPDVLLLDEPFAALDPALRGRVRHELEEIRARFGVPMVLISHDLDDVRELADALVLFDAGRVAAVAHAEPQRPDALPALATAAIRRSAATRPTAA